MHEQNGETKLAPKLASIAKTAAIALEPGWAEFEGERQADLDSTDPKALSVKQYRRTPEQRQRMSEAQRVRWAKPRV